jgi:hypothetical protein
MGLEPTAEFYNKSGNINSEKFNLEFLSNLNRFNLELEFYFEYKSVSIPVDFRLSEKSQSQIC